MGQRDAAAVGRLDGVRREDALVALYDAHVVEVYRYVHRRCRDRSLAEDITQDVFLGVARSVSDPGALGVGWLLRAARNRLIDLVRRNTRHEVGLRLIGTADDVDDHGAATAERVRVEAALDALSPTHRLVLALHYLDELTVVELAQHLERSPKGAEALLTRARAALRDELESDDG